MPGIRQGFLRDFLSGRNFILKIYRFLFTNKDWGGAHLCRMRAVSPK